MHKCTLTLDNETYEAVKEEADEEGVSVEDFLSATTKQAFIGEDDDDTPMPAD